MSTSLGPRPAAAYFANRGQILRVLSDANERPVGPRRHHELLARRRRRGRGMLTRQVRRRTRPVHNKPVKLLANRLPTDNGMATLAE
jgi:hypothetical protein